MRLTNNNVGTLEPSHNKVLFVDKQAAEQRDMKRAVGRTDGKTLQLTQDPLGQKFGALLKAGYEITAQPEGENWYVSPLSEQAFVAESVAKTVGKSLKKHASNELEKSRKAQQPKESDNDGNDGNDGIDDYDTNTFAFVEYKDFNHDSFIDLVVSDRGLKHAHRVGIVNPEDGTYTLRDDVDLGDFEIDLDNMDDPDVDVKEARVVLDSLTVKALRRLMDKLKEEDEESEEDEDDDTPAGEETPAISESEGDAVQAQSLASVKKLLSALAVDKRNGTLKQDNVDKLSELIDELEQAEPPAEGLDELKAEFQRLTNKAGDLSEKLKQESARAKATMGILESCGIQVRGQQHGY